VILPDGPHAELIALCGQARDGNLTADEFKRLEVLLRESDEARELYVQFMQLDAYFARQDRVTLEQLANRRIPPIVPTLDDSASSGLSSTSDSPAAGFGGSISHQPFSFFALSAALDAAGGAARSPWQIIRRFFARPLPAALCASLATAVIVYAAQWMSRGEPEPSKATAGTPTAQVPAGRPYVATLVNVTNCRWDTTRGAVNLTGGGLRPGQSLHLVEGVATIHSQLPGGSVGKFQLEGPLAMTMADDGLPNVLYGKLSCEFKYASDSIALGTPLGRIVVAGDASFGIKAAANEIELHVFHGTASFDVWSTGLDEVPNQLLTAEPGTSLRARVVADGQISVDYGKALENRFVTPASLAASQLLISDQYVKTIRTAKPVAYWRFEEEIDGKVRNEISDRFHLRMGGDAVRLRAGNGTRTAEFGITGGPGYMLSDDVFDGAVNDDYTLELWAKPTCVHHGAMFSLINWSPETTPRGQHRLHLEFCGPRPGDYKKSGFKFDLHPGRICFLNCHAESFSSSPYAVRRWLHLVAVRDHSIMRLYVDGRLEVTDANTEPLGKGMRALMGQLYPPSKFVRDEVTARLYVGEIDEVALYDRPMGEEEIQSHLKLARPAAEANRDF
jgi:hypothetical protein